MFNLQNLKPGRIPSFRHSGKIEIAKYKQPKGQPRIYPPEWLAGVTITRNAVFAGNCAGPETYTKAMKKKDPNYVPKGVWFKWTDQPGIVRHKDTNKPYLALLYPRTIKSTYFVDGVEATPAQLADIKTFKAGGGKTDFKVYDLTEKVEYVGEIEE